MASALKKLLRERPTTEDIERCMEELQTDGPRGAAVLACALLEDVLRLAIINKMVQLSREDHDTLFTGLGPLASFRAKTQVAYALGIIGPKTRHDLDSMREIRNGLAHTGLKIDFHTPEVAALCGGLHALSLVAKPVDKPGPLPPRNQYTGVAKVLMIRLIGTFSRGEDAIPQELATWE